MATPLIPLLFAQLGKPPTSVASDKLALYAREGSLRLLRPGGQEEDLVLDRKLSAYKVFATYTNRITAGDSVLSAIAKLDARQLTAERLMTLLAVGPGLKMTLTTDKAKVLIELVDTPSLYTDYAASGYVNPDYTLPEPV